MELNNVQSEALQEKIKNMSPEELREFQKKNCIFCQIISGNVASKKIYEDDKVIAILDINPANPGHILLLPREHYSIMPLMPDDELGHIAIVAKKLSQSLLKAFKVQGTSVFIANGMAAGQKAQHFMIHLIPRTDNDGIGLMIPEKNISEQDLVQVQQKLVTRVNELFGIKTEESKKDSEEKVEKPKVVEAEFKEKPKEKSKKKAEEKSEADLDEISKLLTGK